LRQIFNVEFKAIDERSRGDQATAGPTTKVLDARCGVGGVARKTIRRLTERILPVIT
jgi:hypothetical protein